MGFNTRHISRLFLVILLSLFSGIALHAQDEGGGFGTDPPPPVPPPPPGLPIDGAIPYALAVAIAVGVIKKSRDDKKSQILDR